MLRFPGWRTAAWLIALAAITAQSPAASPTAAGGADAGSIRVRRLTGAPIVTPQSDASIGGNINGPSLIRVPRWVPRPLGRYYLYFADHNGKYIRLAYSDKIEGPWRIYRPGTLHLAESFFTDHIASPDVVVDEASHRIRLYYHGLTPADGTQHTRVALSEDGIHFSATEEPVGKGTAYWRLFQYDGWWYALAMPGRLFRSRDGLTPFEPGPQLFSEAHSQVHSAVNLRGNGLDVFYTRAGDTPERIVYARVRLGPDWRQWRPGPARECIAPREAWEGAELPMAAARIGASDHPIHALRDPAIYHEGGRAYLLYAVAGESGIAIAEVTLPPVTPPHATPAG